MMASPPDMRGKKRRGTGSDGDGDGGEEEGAAAAAGSSAAAGVVDEKASPPVPPAPEPHPDGPVPAEAAGDGGGSSSSSSSSSRNGRGGDTPSNPRRDDEESDIGNPYAGCDPYVDGGCDMASRQGFAAYLGASRSVLHHPAGLPLLVRALHVSSSSSSPAAAHRPAGDTESFPLVPQCFPDFFVDHGGGAATADAAADAADDAAAAAAAADCGGGSAPDGGSAADAAGPDAAAVDSLFQRCHASWRSEAATPNGMAVAGLTSKLASAMAIAWKKRHGNLAVTGEATAQNPDSGKTGRIDVLVSDQTAEEGDDDGANRPLLLVEVGLRHKLWWGKLNQGLRYLRYQNTLAISEATLLAVVTFEEVGRHNMSARLGVFLVTPKVVQYKHSRGVEFRVSLLWHDDTAKGIADLSRGFGRVLRATCQLPGYIVAARSMIDRGAYRCLGPNCCRIKVNGEEVGSVGVHVLLPFRVAPLTPIVLARDPS
jgi:hypothetical protein